MNANEPLLLMLFAPAAAVAAPPPPPAPPLEAWGGVLGGSAEGEGLLLFLNREELEVAAEVAVAAVTAGAATLRIIKEETGGGVPASAVEHLFVMKERCWLCLRCLGGGEPAGEKIAAPLRTTAGLEPLLLSSLPLPLPRLPLLPSPGGEIHSTTPPPPPTPTPPTQPWASSKLVSLDQGSGDDEP